MELWHKVYRKRGHNDTVVIRYVSSKTWKWIMKRCTENIKGVSPPPPPWHFASTVFDGATVARAPISVFVLKCAILQSVICSLQMNIYLYMYSFSNLKTLMSEPTNRDNGVYAGIHSRSADKKIHLIFLGASHTLYLGLREYKKKARKLSLL
jgi:hypothetical protein